MLSAITESGASYLLTVRSERPIEGCEISPNAFLQLKGGSMDNSTRQKLLDSNPFKYVVKWSRGPHCRICANIQCPRGGSFEPVQWSKSALGGHNLVCNVCLKAGKPQHESTFCSMRFVLFYFSIILLFTLVL